MSNTLTRNFFVNPYGEDDDAHLYEGGWGVCYNEKEPPEPGTILVTLQMEEVKDCNKYFYSEWARNFQKKSGATVTETKNDTFTHLTIQLKDPAETPTYLGFLLAKELPKYVESEPVIFKILSRVGRLSHLFHYFGHRDKE